LAVVQVVLVRPQAPANVGAVARIIRNTGLASLVLVDPGDFRSVECWRTAWGAHDVLEQARIERTLSDALSGSVYTVALSGRRGPTTLDVRDMALEVARLEAHDEVSLVFGPESSGLTRDELVLCGRCATIPSDPSQPSLNLSHAVMVAGYEIFRAGKSPAKGDRRATHGEKQKMLGLLREGLCALGALPPANPEGYFREWAALFQRADLSPSDVRLLEHMARKMLRAR
jgi:tRNA/rRNA methyltransferase